MGFVLGIICIVAGVFLVAIAIAVLLVVGQAKAKKDALKMLEEKKIGDVKLYQKTLKILATSKDAEVPYLCQRLRALYAKQS